jgi:hypothetical protein
VDDFSRLSEDMMLVPCVEGDSGIFPVVAEVACDVQSWPEVAETLPSVPSLLRCLSLSDSALPAFGVGRIDDNGEDDYGIGDERGGDGDAVHAVRQVGVFTWVVEVAGSAGCGEGELELAWLIGRASGVYVWHDLAR